MKCRRCGAETDGAARSCPRCGALLIKDEDHKDGDPFGIKDDGSRERVKEDPLKKKAPTVSNGPYEFRGVPEQPQEQKSGFLGLLQHNRRFLIWGVAGAAALIVAAALIFLFGRERPRPPEPETTTEIANFVMPSLIGEQYAKIEKDAFYSTYFHLVRLDEFSSGIPVGRIIRQSVTPGNSVERGTELVLYVSLGTEKLTVPDITGMTYDQAAAALSALHLVPEKLIKENDGKQKPDTVAEAVPAVGAEVKEWDTVILKIWGPLETTTAAPKTAAPRTAVPTSPATERPQTQPPVTVPQVTEAPPITKPKDPDVYIPPATEAPPVTIPDDPDVYPPATEAPPVTLPDDPDLYDPW